MFYVIDYERKQIVEFKKWTSIEGFHSVIKDLRIPIDVLSLPVTYRAKIKLHGTNSGIYIDGSNHKAMKRTGFITPDNDNAGFARFAYDHIFPYIPNFVVPHVIWGEWAGPGVQKNAAVSMIPEKTWFPFAVEMLMDETWRLYSGPNYIDGVLKTIKTPRVQVLSWEPEIYNVDFCNRKGLEDFAASINEKVKAIDKEDPFVKANYGISGPGEGLVFYPVEAPESIDSWQTRLMFKAKGESHQVVKNKESVILDPEVIKTRTAFTDKFVTEARLTQGLIEVEGADIKKMGAFLKWIGNDILKESEDELTANGIEWKDVAKNVSQTASFWYKKKCMEI